MRGEKKEKKKVFQNTIKTFISKIQFIFTFEYKIKTESNSKT